MCNAWNHPPECQCGWGGEGHLGRRGADLGHRGAEGASADRLRFPDDAHNGRPTISLVTRAKDLGHSILVSVDCRYCNAPIYLFATPEGGFAIFDHLGVPWPKHQCRDLPRLLPDPVFLLRDTIVYGPVEADVDQYDLTEETNFLRGIVLASYPVTLASRRTGEQRKFYLLLIGIGGWGRCLWKTRSATPFAVGTEISGGVDWHYEWGNLLTNVHVHGDPPEIDPKK